MSTSGGQPGNNNAGKNKPWQAAISRALAKRSLVAQRDALDDLAEKLLAKADDGDLEALKELGNRLDGRAHQSQDITFDASTGLLNALRGINGRTADGDPPVA